MLRRLAGDWPNVAERIKPKRRGSEPATPRAPAHPRAPGGRLGPDHAGARLLHERALAIQEKVLGPEHLATAWSLSNLSDLLGEADDFARARLLAERALAIREKVLGPEHPDTARSRDNLASVQCDPRKEIFGPDDPITHYARRYAMHAVTRACLAA